VNTNTTGAPRYSIVTAVYNVIAYLDDFIASIERQDRTDLEVIAVDDGSTDGSLERLRVWQSRRPDLVTVVEKANGGQASARNLGLDRARGLWVTFTDPDDMLDEGYLDAVDRFTAKHSDVAMVATARLLRFDATGETTDTHPLRRHFSGGDRPVDLRAEPGHFYGSAPCAFFRRDLLDQLGLRFPEHLRPNFEDGFLCCSYLLRLEAPVIGFVGSARYIYRKRADSSSTSQRSMADVGRYTAVPRDGYLRILREAQQLVGEVPEWLQNQVIYELSYYFSTQDHIAGKTASASGEIAEEFHRLMREICALLDPEVVASFSARRIKPVWRDILLHSYRDQRWHSDPVLVERVDARQRLVSVSYRFSGAAPDEEFVLDGQTGSAAYQKTRAITYHDKTLLRERILWFPAGARVKILLNGRSTEVVAQPTKPPVYAIEPRLIRAAQRRDRTARPAPDPSRQLSAADRLVLKLSRSGPVQRLYQDAWVLMDRVHDADDSGEILFRHLRRSRKKINAWFVVEAGTPDWRRLKNDGYKRLVAHGSLAWKLLMLNARHLISSHADGAVVTPPEITRLVDPTWRFTFLQHGVIKDDLSNWLNAKPIEVFVVSTPQEYASIAGDGNRYRYSAREVQLTGLPRFDKIRAVGERYPPEKRDLLLLTPTWRHWLLPPLVKGSQRRSLTADFLESEFAREWLGLLRSTRLQQVAHEQGLTIGFLPHPNLHDVLHELDLPPHVQPLSYQDHSVQELFARAAVLVTDYSSIAFNAAYIERPVVYFQFDAARVLGGGHVGQQGYFSYERDGFGPVTTTVAEAEAAIVSTVRAGRFPEPAYRERIEATFPDRDGRCCERVTDAIVASGKRWRPRTS
jgi:glycosyltransferase involved in cell wall biosynthesis